MQERERETDRGESLLGECTIPLRYMINICLYVRDPQGGKSGNGKEMGRKRGPAHSTNLNTTLPLSSLVVQYNPQPIIPPGPHPQPTLPFQQGPSPAHQYRNSAPPSPSSTPKTSSPSDPPPNPPSTTTLSPYTRDPA